MLKQQRSKEFGAGLWRMSGMLCANGERVEFFGFFARIKRSLHLLLSWAGFLVSVIICQTLVFIILRICKYACG